MLSKVIKPFIIAEIGNNHEGNFNTALELIKKASYCRVDAVKFQTFKPDLYVNGKEKKRIKLLKKFSLSNEEFFKLSKYAKKKKLKFISTPFDIPSAVFLNKIVDYFKVSSGDNNYYELIDKVLSFKKKTIISTGLLDKKSLDKLINYLLKKNIQKNKLNILHCVASYPTKPENINLSRITYIKKKFKINTGFSDHTIGPLSSIIATILGAKIIEKHFTLDNNFSNFRDHKISLNPVDMENFVCNLENLSKINFDFSHTISKDEKNNYYAMRRAFYWAKNIKKGQKIESNHIKFVRPSFKKSSVLKKSIINKFASKDIEKNNVIRARDLKF